MHSSLSVRDTVRSIFPRVAAVHYSICCCPPLLSIEREFLYLLDLLPCLDACIVTIRFTRLTRAERCSFAGSTSKCQAVPDSDYIVPSNAYNFNAYFTDPNLNWAEQLWSLQVYDKEIYLLSWPSDIVFKRADYTGKRPKWTCRT